MVARGVRSLELASQAVGEARELMSSVITLHIAPNH